MAGDGFGLAAYDHLWVLIVLGVPYIVKVDCRQHEKEKKDVSAVDILRKRYAKER
jgi:uncharacterized membrane protein